MTEEEAKELAIGTCIQMWGYVGYLVGKEMGSGTFKHTLTLRVRWAQAVKGHTSYKTIDLIEAFEKGHPKESSLYGADLELLKVVPEPADERCHRLRPYVEPIQKELFP